MSEERVIHAPESGRFYNKSGQVVLEVPCSSKNSMRKPTIRDLKKNGWVPSVSEVLKVLSRAYLDAWKEEQLLKAAYAEPPQPGALYPDWAQRISEKSREYTRMASDRGTEIHAGIERFFQHGEVSNDPAIARACESIAAVYPSDMAQVRHGRSFISPDLDFGGTTDIEVFEGDRMVIIADVKTKDLKNFKAPSLENGMQLGAYALGHNFTGHLDQIIVDRETGETRHFRWGTESLKPERDNLSAAFLKTLAIWRFLNNIGD